MQRKLSSIVVCMILAGCAQPPSQTLAPTSSETVVEQQHAMVVSSSTVEAAPPGDMALLQQRASEVPFNLDMRTQGHTLHGERTRNGVTVTLLWGYRDRERVVLAYTVRSAASLRPIPDATLTTDTGARFRPREGYAEAGPLSSVPPGYGVFLDQFRMTPPHDEPAPLPLRFDVTVIEEAPPSGEAGVVDRKQP